MERPEFVNGCFYHVFNRGVDKRKIYLDTRDHSRFINGLHDFNDMENIINFRRKYKNSDESIIAKARKKLVDIVCFCLMSNHFHLLLRQLSEGGIPKFMQKLSTSYAMFFNKKLERRGRLYEGRFKAKLIEDDEYIKHLSRYIHLNPLDFIQPDWRERGIKSWERASKFLEEYKWSTYHDFIGKDRFPHIINKEPMGWYFKNPEHYQRYVKSWSRKDMQDIKALSLLAYDLGAT